MEAEDSLPSSQKPAIYHTLSKINAVQDLIMFNEKYVLILSSHLCLVLTTGPFPAGFSKKKSICTSSKRTLSNVPSFLSPLFDYGNSIWLAVQVIQLLLVPSPPVPCYIVPLKARFFLTVFKMLGFWCER